MASEQEPTSAAEPTSRVERATELSEDMIQAAEDSSRAAIEALGRFVVSVEEALPPEVEANIDFAKKLTDSAVEMAQQLIQTQSEFLRKAVESAGTSLTRSEDDK